MKNYIRRTKKRKGMNLIELNDKKGVIKNESIFNTGQFKKVDVVFWIIQQG